MPLAKRGDHQLHNYTVTPGSTSRCTCSIEYRMGFAFKGRSSMRTLSMDVEEFSLRRGFSEGYPASCSVQFACREGMREYILRIRFAFRTWRLVAIAQSDYE